RGEGLGGGVCCRTAYGLPSSSRLSRPSREAPQNRNVLYLQPRCLPPGRVGSVRRDRSSLVLIARSTLTTKTPRHKSACIGTPLCRFQRSWCLCVLVLNVFTRGSNCAGPLGAPDARQ